MKKPPAKNAAVAEPDHDAELPEGWAQADLASFSTLITKGTTPTSLGFEYQPKGISFVRVENLTDGRIERSTITTFINKEADEALKRSRLQMGDLLFSIAGTIGRTALVIVDDLPANTNQALAIIRGTEPVLIPRLLQLALMSSVTQQQAQSDARGGSMNNISLEDVRTMRLTIPPRAEQGRIIPRLEELLRTLNQAEQRLAKVPKILKAFRQSVLAAACSGRLTEDWREGINNLPSTHALLQDVLSQRRQMWDAECMAAGRNRKYVNPIVFDQNSDLPAIPETWIWTSADSLCSQITDGEHIQPPYRETGLPMLTAKHVRDGYVVFDDAGLVSDADFKKCLQRCAPTKDDILIVSVGATTGRAAIVEKCPPFAIVRSVLLLRPLIEPRYFLGWIHSPWCFNWMQSASGASAQPHLYINDTRRMPFPLPTLQEQHEIVRRVEALFKLADTIEERVKTATKRADKLTQSILAKAFRGELVPTEAELARKEGRDYEPASVLLERIRAEREKSATSTNGTKPRRATAGKK